MNNIEECFLLVLEFFKDEPHKAFWWFTTENPLLGGVSPARMIEIGRTEKLLTFIKGLLSENVRDGK